MRLEGRISVKKKSRQGEGEMQIYLIIFKKK